MAARSWPTRRLGELAEFRNGLNYTKANFGVGLRVLNVGDFGDRLFAPTEGLDEIRPDGAVRDDNLLLAGDIIFVRSNGNRELIGRSLLVRDPEGPLSHSAFTIRTRFITAQANPRFYAYVFRTRLIRDTLSAQGNGTNISNLNQTILENLRVPEPPREVQDEIVDVLGAYDDLIENNTKRIKILEEMTSVAFSLMEAGASAATERALGDIVDEAGGVVRTGPFGSALHESDYTAEGSPVVMPKNLIAGRIDTSDIARIPDEVVEKLAQHKLSVGDIVYGRRGDIGRRAFIGKRQVGWLCGTGCLRISLPLGGPLHPRYLHEYLGKPDVVAGIAGAAVGATMPNLNTSILRAVPVKVPDTTTQSRFSEVALVNDDLIEVLRSANGVLRAQRDLLLPRLISGEVALDTAETDPTAPRAHGKPSRVSDRVAADSTP
ncbi:MAG: restriction endonuclease subunit S [Labilithrix sp.]